MNNWNYPLRKLIPQLILVIAVFAFCLVSGSFVPPDYANQTLEQLGKSLALLGNLGPFALLIIIFLNNAVKALAAIALGILIGLPPLIFVAFNGFTIGVIVSALKSTVGSGVIIATLAPHGIIELGAFFICAALGLSVGIESLKFLRKQNSNVRGLLLRSLKFYVKWILAAFLVAAIIEIFITPGIIQLSGGIELSQ